MDLVDVSQVALKLFQGYLRFLTSEDYLQYDSTEGDRLYFRLNTDPETFDFVSDIYLKAVIPLYSQLYEVNEEDLQEVVKSLLSRELVREKPQINLTEEVWW